MSLCSSAYTRVSVAGPTGTSAGIEALRARVTGLGKEYLHRHLLRVLPLRSLPDINPALRAVAVALRLRTSEMLFISGSEFGTDWVDKGYPVAKGNRNYGKDGSSRTGGDHAYLV